jgi:hypothetical protein
MVRITLAGLALIFSMSIIAPHGVADEAAIQIAQAKSKKPKAARKIVVAKVVGKTSYQGVSGPAAAGPPAGAGASLS